MCVKVKSHDGGALQHGQVSNDGLACVGLTKRQRRTAAKKTPNKLKQNKENPSETRRKHLALLQLALGAATFQSSFHLLGVRGAVGAPEHHLPPSGLGDAAADTRGRRCLAGPGTIHAGNLAGRRARSQRLVALQLLPHHLSLARELWKHTQNVFCMWWQSFLFSGRLHLWDKTTVLSVNLKIKKVIDQQFYCYFWA